MKEAGALRDLARAHSRIVLAFAGGKDLPERQVRRRRLPALASVGRPGDGRAVLTLIAEWCL